MATAKHSNRAHVQVGLTANVETFFTRRHHAEEKKFCKPYWSRRVMWEPSLRDGRNNAEGVRQFQPRVTPWDTELTHESETLKVLARNARFGPDCGFRTLPTPSGLNLRRTRLPRVLPWAGVVEHLRRYSDSLVEGLFKVPRRDNPH